MARVTRFIDTPAGRTIREALRWGVLAFASAVVQYLLTNVGNLELDPSFILIVTAGLRFADSALHKSGIVEKGITRF